MIGIFFALYFILRLNAAQRSSFIALSSLLFYASWYPPALFLLFYHTLLGYYASRTIAKNKSKLKLFATLVLALLPLLFFKYFDFFLVQFDLEALGLVLPLGLSFYTFSMLGYYVDIYKREIPAEQSFIQILLFVAFWPHLAAGPILRAKNIFSDILHRQKLSLELITLAAVLIAAGLVKKLLLADNIGAYVNWNISYGIENMSMLEAWATILGFSAQIYADFSAYSDMAIGFALLMGFRLPANFNYPYRASSITDFWHRWHISLSTWFRDYLYIPLGGSKNGIMRAYVNIMIVFIVSAMWHGVGLGFLIWGIIHGAMLVLEKIFSRHYAKTPLFLRWFVTMTIVVVAWSFFRLDYADASLLIQKMFAGTLSFEDDSPYYIAVLFFLLSILVLDHLCRFYKVSKEGFAILNVSSATLFVLALLLCCALTFSGDPLPFIYFEF